jgi:thiol-disulfide isomerase/thioredoxin
MRYLLILCTAILFAQCQKSGTILNAKIQNAANMKAVMDQIYLNGNTIPVGKADIDGDGNFKIEFKEGLSQGFYRIKIGIKYIFLILDGSEKNLKIEGDLSNLELYEFKVAGSNSSEYYVNSMRQFAKNPQGASADYKKTVDNAPNALSAAILAFQTLVSPDTASIPYLKTVKAKLDKEMPNSNYAIQFGQGIAQLERELTGTTGGVKLGAVAPDIELPDPTGKMRKLSDLRGKVVLLDFWASWCGPCRRENPNVVKIYNKYKDKGFTVFSVSLDGLNLQARSRMGPEGLESALKESKSNWKQAIQQDGLPWENHVSDLQQWDSAPAQLYGVQSIPQTFLLDKDGKIVALNPRNTLEQELEKIFK